MENLKVQFVTPRISIEKREANLFYYELRDSEVDNGYTIEIGRASCRVRVYVLV